MDTITTVYKTHKTTGKGRITAKGGGKQRTTPYDHARSANANHGAAAGILGNVLGWAQTDTIVHMGFNDGTHRFERVRKS
jgi:hypothetical protein